ncbi:MAG: TonB-dependent receptor [Sphingobacteriales bacterium]|nr:TonB-dependent receptor [Sphingobacteriales bacterium]
MSPKLFKKLFSFTACFIISGVLYAQTVVKGKVTDAEGNPLPVVTVQVKGSKTATITNSKGEYSINASTSDILVFTSASYSPVEIPVSGNSFNVTLTLANKGLDEVVVIGYGTQKKRDLTGAVSSVKAKDLVISSGPEIGSMLKGKVAGLTIRQNSAQPGGGLDILVRGAGSVNASNQPLFVIDGFPIFDLQQPESGGRYQAGTQSILNSFNPNDIESIEVLKDASATSIYGARAANGVILITTKKGIDGTPRVQYSNNFSIQKFNTSVFDVLPLNEWMQVRNEAGQEQWDFDNGVIPYGSKTRAQAEANPINGLYKKLYTQNAINNVGRGTDWLSLVTRNGSTQQHNISVTGGTKFTKYLLSGNYYDQKGIAKNSEFKRFTFRANIDQDINKYVKLGVNLTASRIDNNNTQLGGDQFENSGIIRAAIQQGPHIQAIDENGNYPLNPQLALQPNPYSLLTITDESRIERFLGNVYVDISPIKDLVIKLKAGMDKGSSNRGSYLPTTTLHGALEQGRATVGNINNENYLLEATANYTKMLGAHKLNFLAGVSEQKFSNFSNSSGSTGYITDAFLYHNLGAGSIQLPTLSSGAKNVLASYFGRVNYSYKGKYLATVTVRTDGASVFARNNKWGTFPSAAVAWDVAQESFFKSLNKTFSQFKLRFSYGQTGNAGINSNAFAAYSAYPAWLSGNDTRLIGVSLSRLENPDLKWETTTGTNIGLDFSILNGRVDGSVEVFNNTISDLLATKALNSYNQVNSIIANIGKTQSKGFEVTINTRNIQTKDLQWKTLFALSRYKDNWKERAPDWKPAIYENANDPIRAMYSRLSDGILQIGEQVPASQPQLKPGMIKIKDIDGFQRDGTGNPMVDANGRFLRTGKPDGRIDDADTKLLGTSDPSYMIGITNIITYKRFTLNFDLNGLFGRRMTDPNYTAYGVSAYGVYSNGYNALRTVKERWTPTNPSTTHPSSFWGFSPYSTGDFFLQKAWYIRLQNVSLSYSIPTKWAKGVFSAASIHADAQNLFVITPYTGVDPETDSYTAAYPYIRTFTFGVNFTF